MALFTNDTNMGEPENPTTSAITRTTLPPPLLLPPFSRPTTLSPGHAAILEMHANSYSNAIIYVLVVLALYVLGMSIVVIKYIRSERYEARLSRLFHNLVQRDRFFRLSRRRSSLPKCEPTALSPTQPHTSADLEEESKV